MKRTSVPFAIGMLFVYLNSQAVQAVCPCAGDVNNSGGIVNVVDAVITYDCARIGQCGGCLAATGCDVNCDGTVDFVDVGAVWWQFMQRPGDACNQPSGACTPTFPGNAPSCVVTYEMACEGVSPDSFFLGTYYGDTSICHNGQPVQVPAVSEWGLLILSLALLSVATLILRLRRSTLPQ